MTDLVQHLINGLSIGAVYALIALGYTMVYGVLQLINFAHSEVFMLGAFAGFYAHKLLPKFAAEPRLLALLAVAMVVCAALGFFIERLAYRPLRNKPRLNSLITAIGVSMFIQAVGQLPWALGASPQTYPPLLSGGNLLGDAATISLTVKQVVTLVSAVILMVGLHRLVFHTKLGSAMRAVSFDGRIAALMGINQDFIISFTFMLGSALAAAAGILYAINYARIDPTMGLMLGLKAFVAAVTGGIGNIKGAMLGGLLIGLTEEFVAGYMTSSYRDAVVFSLLIAVLVFKPSGLLGRTVAEKV